ncbi:expressed unknown protein [Seminavis robusta]|uniref:Hint domain-containing protein n=1 Tax=Seminavis robusta TaxID=568900 RepID=A0A9N8ETI1_9STRA|nr:expressed unknown protein [Seminavis robusta]
MKSPFFLLDLALLKDTSALGAISSAESGEPCEIEGQAHYDCLINQPPSCLESVTSCLEQISTGGEAFWNGQCPDADYNAPIPGPVECACIQDVHCDWFPSCCDACASITRVWIECINVNSDLDLYCPDLSCSGDSSGGGGDTSGEAAPTPTPASSCFSATASVEVLGKGQVEMQKLKVGDKVLTTTETDEAEYQPVYAFGHRSPTTLGRFLQITTDTDSLEITGEHLLYVADKSHPVHCDGTANQVKKIKTVMKEGLYAPLTPGGKLVINGIQTSAYIALQKDDQELFTTLNGLITIPHSSYIHLYLAPLRVVCLGISSMPCQLMHEHGMPLYIKWGIDVINMATDTPIGIFLSGFVAVEALFGATLGPLIVFSVCVAYSFVRKTHTAKTNKVKTA